MTEAFLPPRTAAPLLLPRIAAVGALDEAPLALAGALDLPPAVDRSGTAGRADPAGDGAGRARRRARHGRPGLAAGGGAGRLLDEAHREGVALDRALPDLVDEGYAEHWADTLRFLQIVTAHWPGWLADSGLMDAAARGVQLLSGRRRPGRDAPPAPGGGGGHLGRHPGLAGLMAVVARLPRGRWCCRAWTSRCRTRSGRRWTTGIRRPGCAPCWPRWARPAATSHAWPARPAARRRGPAAIGQALLPAAALRPGATGSARTSHGLERLEPADQQEEAVAIALALRQALESAGRAAALVTPDRLLAARVAAELARFGVVVDDSAGEPLADTPPGAFLRLLAQAVADGLSPVALLCVLKHPLAALGLRPARLPRPGAAAGARLPARPGAATGHRRAAGRGGGGAEAGRGAGAFSTGSRRGWPRCCASPRPDVPPAAGAGAP